MGGIPTPQLPGLASLGGSQGARGMGMPFQQPAGGQIAEGIDAFVRNFIASKRGEQEFHRNRYLQDVQMMMQGLISPGAADLKRMAKDAKLGGLPVNTTASAEEQQALYQQKVQDSAAAQAQLRSPFMTPGQPGPAMTGGAPPGVMPGQAMPGFRAMPTAPTATPGLPAMPIGGGPSGDPALNAVLTSGLQGPSPTPYAPTPQSLARPGLLSRLFNPAGNVSMASPFGQYLTKMAEAAKQGAPLGPQNLQQSGELNNLSQVLQRNQMMDQNGQLTLNGQHRQILTSLLNPSDPKHDEAAATAYRMGILPNLPVNTAEDLVRSMGGSPQQAGEMMMWKEFGLPMMQMKFGLAEKSVNRFNGNYGSALQYWDDMLRQGYSKISPGLTMEEAKQRSEIASDLFRYTGVPSNIAMLSAEVQTDPRLAAYKDQVAKLVGRYPTQTQFEQNTKFPAEMYNRHWELNNDTGRLINMQDNTAINVLNATRESNIVEYNRIYDQLKDRVKEQGWDEGSVNLLNQLGAVDLKGAQIKYPMRQPDGTTRPYVMTDPQGAVQGAVHWYATHHFTNVPPYLGAPPQDVPGQQAPQPSRTTVQVPGSMGAYGSAPNPLSGFESILGGAAGAAGNWALRGISQLEGGTGPNATQWTPEMQQILNSQHLNIPMPEQQAPQQ